MTVDVLAGFDRIASLVAAPVLLLIAVLGSAQESAVVPPNDSLQSQTLAEVVVTARRREERLQTTPISIAAYSGQDLEVRGVTTTTDLGAFTPNLVTSSGSGVSGNSSAASFFIRGIGQIDFLLNTDPGVGLYIDDVYIGRSIGADLNLLDLERVEVLRGPQGTLFGRNTIGGAISLTSRPPTSELEGNVAVAAGSSSLKSARGVLNIPISTALAARVSFESRERDGYVTRLADGIELGDENSQAARVALRWEATDRLVLDLIGDAVRRREQSPPTTAVAINGASLFGGFFNAVLSGSPGCVPPPGSPSDPACFNEQWLTGNPDTTNGTVASQSDVDGNGLSLRIQLDANEWWTLKSISAYRSVDAIGRRDGDGSPFPISQTHDTWTHDQFSQELQALSAQPAAGIDWIVGAYYFRERGVNHNQVDFAPVSLLSGGAVDNDSTAAFGQLTWHATDELSLTAGLRYTKETKRFTPEQFVTADRGTGIPPGTPILPNVEASTSVDELTPLVNLAYQWTPGFMTYVTYSEGFKSGGFTQRVFPPLPQTPSFDPEYATVYEAGFKYSSEDQRLRLNGAAYYTDYTDLQVQVLLGPAPITRNAANATVKGFELELAAVPVGGLKIESGIGLTDASYDEIGPGVIGLTPQSKFAQVPEWSGNAGISYELGVGEGRLTPRVDWLYRSEIYMDALNTPQITQDAVSLINASLTYESPGGRWLLALTGTNLGDERYFVSGFADLQTAGNAEVIWARPREWDLSVQFNF
jgi:iron complex outermembrane receptor protein